LGVRKPEIANNGLEALAKLRSNRYDVVLLDISMPDMSGFEVAHTVRSNREEYGDSHYIVAVTANAMSGDKEECLRSGMNDYLAKPFTIRQMRDALERVI
jgi:CheY-like chemotaxis protein